LASRFINRFAWRGRSASTARSAAIRRS